MWLAKVLLQEIQQRWPQILASGRQVKGMRAALHLDVNILDSQVLQGLHQQAGALNRNGLVRGAVSDEKRRQAPVEVCDRRGGGLHVLTRLR